MDRNMSMSKGMIALGILGATVGVYAATNMSSRARRKMMKRGKRALSTLGVMKGLNIL